MKMFTASPVPRVLAVLAAGIFSIALQADPAIAQSITVLPVIVQLQPGEMASSVRVVNQGTAETSFQVRAFAWSQGHDGVDALAASSELVVSPPLGTIAPNGAQVIRLILRRRPEKQEATYRIIVDQIPPPAAPGTVRIALRMSIPVFAPPATRVAPNVRFHVERQDGKTYLVAVNDGLRHDRISGLALSLPTGAVLKMVPNPSPYILAGATRRWELAAGETVPPALRTLHLSAQLETSGAIDQQISLEAGK